jgi:uncharacterized metal-binding protein YceD (DUF177 family)
MRIKLSTLPKGGTLINDTLNKNDLNDQMNASFQNDVRFISDVGFSLQLTPRAFGAEGKGSIEASFEQQCARCQEYRCREKKVDLSFIAQARPNPDAIEDDLNLVYCDDDQINIGEYCQEMLIINIETFWSPPRKDNENTCSLCGLCPDWDIEDASEKHTQNLKGLLDSALNKKSKKL